jgi:hypothetical protein
MVSPAIRALWALIPIENHGGLFRKIEKTIQIQEEEIPIYIHKMCPNGDGDLRVRVNTEFDFCGEPSLSVSMCPFSRT